MRPLPTRVAPSVSRFDINDQINKSLCRPAPVDSAPGPRTNHQEMADALEVPLKSREHNPGRVWLLPLGLPTDDEEDSALGDFIEHEEIAPPDETVINNRLRQNLREALNDLPPVKFASGNCAMALSMDKRIHWRKLGRDGRDT